MASRQRKADASQGGTGLAARLPTHVPLSRESIYAGIDNRDVEFLQKFRVASEPQEGFVVDFVGARTAIEFNAHIVGLNGAVEDIPVPRSFHAETVEWVGALRAVEEAHESFCVCEIGAGWGPWIVSTCLAARRSGIQSTRMIAVEPDPGHIAFLRRHVAANGLDGCRLDLFEGVAGPTCAEAFFPVIDPKSQWGISAVFETADDTMAEGGQSAHRRVPSFDVETILSDTDKVDLVHVDIQGGERMVIPAGIDPLCRKAKWLVIGTHSRSIEGELMELLSQHGWRLTNEKPCRFVPAEGAITDMNTTLDGTQVWRNARFA